MELKNANKSFVKDKKKIIILKDVNIKFELGKIYIIIGESGAGKSTLINILGLLDKLDSGTILFNNKPILKMNDNEMSNIRLKEIGMIFQDYYLNPRLSAKDNILIATLINKKIKPNNRNKLVETELEKFKLNERSNHYPHELSGGEQQRVCILRALINNPNYILADEPTGSLDPKNSNNVMNILKDLAKNGKCIIMVTHDYRNIKYADYVYTLKNGKLIEENKDAIYKKYVKKEKF